MSMSAIKDKKVLILTNNSAGLYNFRNELISELLKTHDVTAVTPVGTKVDLLTELGCRVRNIALERRQINPFKDIKLTGEYKKIIAEEKPDFVITYTIKPNIFGSIACKKMDIPYFVNITGLGTTFQKTGVVRYAVIRMYRYALMKARTVFFENESNRDTFTANHIVDEKRTSVLHGAGVNLKRYPLLEYPDNETFHFLFIGRVMKEKGINELLEAMKRLVSEKQNCCLDIVGGLQENYKDKITKYEKEGWLHYFGYQKDVHPYIQSADCFVLPSYHEGMANTNLECAASGRPIITSNIPGCREAVIDGKTGLLFESKNTEKLYLAMKEMMGLDREQREKMGLMGRNHMEEIFDKRKVVQQTIEIIRNNLEGIWT